MFKACCEPSASARRDHFTSWIKTSDTSLGPPDQILRILLQSSRNKNRRRTSDCLRIYRLVWAKTNPESPAPTEGYLLRLGQGSSSYATSLLIFAEQQGIGADIYRMFPPRTQKMAEGGLPLGWVIASSFDQSSLADQAPEELKPAPLPVSHGRPPLKKPAPKARDRSKEVIKPQHQARVVLGERSRALNGLLKQAHAVPVNDSFALNRIVESINQLEDEDSQRTVADVLQEKMKKAGIWKNHRFAPIMVFLGLMSNMLFMMAITLSCIRFFSMVEVQLRNQQ